jgi:transporter family-2 protein
MDRSVAIVLTLLVGGLVAFQPPVNAALARHVGDLGAAFTSLTISWVIVAVLLVAAGEVGSLRGVSEFRPAYVLGGLGGAAIVFVSLVTVRSLGAGGVTAVLVAGQLIVSVVLDRLGFLDLEQVGITAQRLGGVALLILGTVLITSR